MRGRKKIKEGGPPELNPPEGNWGATALKAIGLLATLGCFSFGWNWYRDHQERWRKVDADLNSLTLGILAADKFARAVGSELPDQGADKIVKIRFIRKTQQYRHPEAWKRLGNYIVELEEDSEVSEWEKSVQGHRKIETMSHKNFVAFEYSSRGAAVLASYTADMTTPPTKMLLPIQLLTYSKGKIPEQVRRRWAESGEMPMYIVPSKGFGSVPGQYPVVDLSRTDVQKKLRSLGKSVPPNALAVPAFNEMNTETLVNIFPTNEELEK